jgi:radical SAM protein with 4Fe4S-binding SPASM domain
MVKGYIKSLSEGGVSVSMNSNLTLLTPEKAEILKDCGIRSILVSLPSGDPRVCDQIAGSKGSLRRIIRGINLAKSYGFPIYVNMVVSKCNISQINQTAALVSSLGLPNFAVTKASDPSSGRGFTDQLLTLEEFHQMQEELEKAGLEYGLRVNSLEANPVCSYGGHVPVQGYKFCTAGKTTCTIGFDGNVRPCNRASESYGNIGEGLKVVWERMEEWRTEEMLPEVCGNCAVRARCMGGCKADAFTAFGSKKAADPMCDQRHIPLHVLPKNPISQTQDTRFEVNPRLQIRPEPFGSILFVSTSAWVPVDRRLEKLFGNGKEVVLLEEIQEVLQVGLEKVIPVASYLKHKQVLL